MALGTAVPEGADRPETSGERRSRLVLAALMAGGGAAHFLFPEAYFPLIPRRLGDPRLIVHLSGVAEATAGVLLGITRTRRIGGWFTAAVLVAIFPGNVAMAIDSGWPGPGGRYGTSTWAWLRLPLQVPLVLWALRHARRNR